MVTIKQLDNRIASPAKPWFMLKVGNKEGITHAILLDIRNEDKCRLNGG